MIKHAPKELPTPQFKHSMLDPQFGKLVPEDFPDERDAIHIATAAVYAEHGLNPGDHVGLSKTSERPDVMGYSDDPLGIVDPFLVKPVKKGERFWVFLYPGSIRSLRHNWSHPDFDTRIARAVAERLIESPAHKRMKAFAASLDWESYNDEDSRRWFSGLQRTGPITMEEVLNHAKEWLTDEQFWCEGGRFEGQDLYPEFWDDFETITGIEAPDKKRGHFLTCSC